MPVFSFWTGIYRHKMCLWLYVFCIAIHKRRWWKKKNRFENVYVEIQKMYFAFLLFHFAKCVSWFVFPMGFRRGMYPLRRVAIGQTRKDSQFRHPFASSPLKVIIYASWMATSGIGKGHSLISICGGHNCTAWVVLETKTESFPYGFPVPTSKGTRWTGPIARGSKQTWAIVTVDGLSTVHMDLSFS